MRPDEIGGSSNIGREGNFGNPPLLWSLSTKISSFALTTYRQNEFNLGLFFEVIYLNSLNKE